MKIKVKEWQQTPKNMRLQMLTLVSEYQKAMRELEQRKKPTGEAGR